jgi:phosphoglycerol transferase MdoB-like AlkP superfamily enzyme
MKNYFRIFISIYAIIVFTKYIFVFYLDFNDLTLSTISYAIFWGYRFDFAISAIVSLIIFLFSFHKGIFSFTGSLVIVSIFLVQISDILYFNEANRHIGYEITDILNDTYSLFSTAYSQHTTITYFAIIFSIILFNVLYKILQNINLKQNYFLNIFIIFIVSLFFARGMFQGIPLNPWQSNQIGDSKLASISLNGAYNTFYFLLNQNKKLKKIKLPILNNIIIKKHLKKLYLDKNTTIDLPIIKTKPNVVFLFLESWSAKYLLPYGYEYNTTPYFNILLKKSIRPKMMIAGGHRTTEGLFCSMVSMQNPLGKSIAKTQLQNNDYNSIINILNKQGYKSVFFQGTSKETSGTGSLAQKLGYKLSYGKKDIKIRIYKENSWGVQDIDLYNFVEKKLQNYIKEPFVIGINGATTHDDKIPNNVKQVDFTKDKKLNKQLNALNFSDLAMNNFINNIENIYPNTIFVIFADHCGGGINGLLENYQIPFAIYSKQLIKAKYYDIYLSQRDIAPTIFDLVVGNYDNLNTTFTGKSLISNSKFFADYYHNGILGLIENNKNIELNLQNNNLSCFKLNNLKQDKIKCSKEYFELKNKILSFTIISQKMLFQNNNILAFPMD